MRRFTLCSVLAGWVVLMAAFEAYSADDSERYYGVRAGFGGGPDQFVIGVQADMGKILGNIHFVPSIDAGFGDHLTTIAFNGDLKAFLPLPKSSFSLFGLAGPSIVYWSAEGGGSDTEIGVCLGGGVRAALGDKGWYNLEARFGIGDVPDWRILFGVLLGGR
jgi:hypothetical protein